MRWIMLLKTSFVKSFKYVKDNNEDVTYINVETQNSIYEFEKVDDE